MSGLHALPFFPPAKTFKQLLEKLESRNFSHTLTRPTCLLEILGRAPTPRESITESDMYKKGDVSEFTKPLKYVYSIYFVKRCIFYERFDLNFLLLNIWLSIKPD